MGVINKILWALMIGPMVFILIIIADSIGITVFNGLLNNIGIIWLVIAVMGEIYFVSLGRE